MSGGHFNPAVSLGFLFKEGTAHWARNFAMFIGMVIAQGIGAVLGAAICTGGFDMDRQPNKRSSVNSYSPARLCPSNGCNDGGELLPKVLVAEAVCTFFFVSFIFMVVKHNGAQDLPINAMAIALSLFLALNLSGGISGGCINPAVGLVQSLYQKFIGAKKFPNAPEVELTYIPAYVGGPFLGAFVAAWFQKIIHERALKAAENSKEEEYQGLN